MSKEHKLVHKIMKMNLVLQIVIGIVIGLILVVISPTTAGYAGILGTLFVSALKAIAPILVFVLVMASIANQEHGTKTHMKPIIVLYLLGTVMAALTAVLMSFTFPTEMILNTSKETLAAPEGIQAVLTTLLLNVVDNPVHALQTSNFIGILVWAIALGFLFKHSSDSTKTMLNDFSDAISKLVKFVISLAPIGIFGLVAGTFSDSGLSEITKYFRLLAILVGSMAIVALIVNPIIVFIKIRRNPYPLVFQCLRESGVTAFFTRSSAANIPVNMELCKKLDLHEDTYSVSIPLGATINMGGAAVTITTLTLSAAYTLGIEVDILSALLLSILASASACGASGVAGGSLLLIPLACDLFGIPNDVAMQVVGTGFIMSVIQDSAETGLNSSTDVLFTAAACMAEEEEKFHEHQ